MEALVICKNLKIFNYVCVAFGLDKHRVDYIENERDMQGIDPKTPVFTYFSAGFPDWYFEMDKPLRFKHVINLPELK